MARPEPTAVHCNIPLFAGHFWSTSDSGGSSVEKLPPLDPSQKSSRERRLGLGPILVVDDDRSIREIIAETLEFEGYIVEQASNGAEALKMIEEHLPSLVLLDMRMPVLDGWGVARALKTRGVRVPIIVLTAAKDARSWAGEIGAAAYLDKPFEDTDLLAAVEQFSGKFPTQ